MSEYAAVAIIDAAIDALSNGSRKVTLMTMNRRTIDFQPGGSPPPRSGQFYIALDDEGEDDEGLTEGAMAERYKISVTISVRVGQQAQDQQDLIYRQVGKKLSMVAQQVKNCLHAQQDIRVAACANLPGGVAEFTEPLFFKTGGAVMLKGPEWCGEVTDKTAGWAVKKLVFTGMRRIMYAGSIT